MFGVKEVTENGETTYVADIVTTYHVTFYGLDGEVLHVESSHEASITIPTIPVTPKTAEEKFSGWKENGGSTLYKEGDTITIDPESTEGIKLYAQTVKAFWIYFDENDTETGGGASYTGPRYVEAGKKASTVKPTESEKPTWAGYDFAGWYADAEGNTPFDWDQYLTKDTTVYAKWTAKTNTTYTIVVWTQKETDEANDTDADNTYDYVKSISLNGETGKTVGKNHDNVTYDINIASLNRKDYTSQSEYDLNSTGFKAGRVEVTSADNKIKADGSTVVNVYFDRNAFTLTFQRDSNSNSYTYTPTNDSHTDGVQKYGKDDGEYYELKWWNDYQYTGWAINIGNRWYRYYGI